MTLDLNRDRLSHNPNPQQNAEIGQRVARPADGSVWRHFKHDPINGRWYEYTVICVAEAGRSPYEDAPGYFTAIHTETGDWHDILPAVGSTMAPPDDDRNWLFPAVDEPHVIYKSTTDNSGKTWARPLSMFMDGRFKQIDRQHHAVAKAYERREFDRLEDGDWYWFPSLQGALPASALRAIADELDRLNRIDDAATP